MTEEAEKGGVLIYRFHPTAFWESGFLEPLIDAFQPDVIVGASAPPSLRASEIAGDVPLWVDLFGDATTRVRHANSLD